MPETLDEVLALDAQQKKESDEMKHETCYNGTDRILHVDVINKFSHKDAQKLVAIIKDYVARFGAINMLCDMEQSKGYTIKPKTRRLLMATWKELKPNFAKIALVGASLATGFVCRVIFALSGESKTVKFFDKKNCNQAVTWLRTAVKD